MRSTFDQHLSEPGRMLVAESTTPEMRKQLQAMGYSLTFSRLTSGPITAIMLDRKHGTMWGGASNHGDDYGIGW
jgi:gamma-glutamyltranspeptidase/glutathione hydrolase